MHLFAMSRMSVYIAAITLVFEGSFKEKGKERE